MKELRDTINNAQLTKTQKMIAKFILDNTADACFMTSTEIASKLEVSESSVIRFSRSLGYDGFMDFQKNLSGLIRIRFSAYPVLSQYLLTVSLKEPSWKQILIIFTGILKTLPKT